MNKFDQVSSDGHHMSLAVGWGRVGGPQVLCWGWDGRVPQMPVGGRRRGCTVRSNASSVMVTWEPPTLDRIVDGQTRMKT